MKPFIFSLLLVISFAAWGQAGPKYVFRVGANTDSVHARPSAIMHTPAAAASQPILTITENGKAVAYQFKDSSIRVVDSAAAIRVFFRSARMQLEAIQKQSESEVAAREVLQYANADGTVRDKKKFTAAVKKYQAILKKK